MNINNNNHKIILIKLIAIHKALNQTATEARAGEVSVLRTEEQEMIKV